MSLFSDIIIQRFAHIGVAIFIVEIIIFIFGNGFLFHNSIWLVFYLWLLGMYILFILREFCLNGNQIVDSNSISDSRKLIAKYDKDGNAKVPRRLYFEK
jgi:hypothetical protein